MEEHPAQKQNNTGNAPILKIGVFFVVMLGAVAAGMLIKFVFSPGVKLIFPVIFPALVEAAFILFALAAYLISSRPQLVESQKNLYAVGVAVVIAYLVNIYLAFIGIFAVPSALAAFLIVPIGKRRDAFIGNLFCNFLVLVTLVTEYVFSSAADLPFTVLDIAASFSLGVSLGSFAAYTLSNKTGRFWYVVKGILIGIASAVIMLFLHACQGVYQILLIADAADRPTLAAILDEYVLRYLLHAALYCTAPVVLGLLLQPLFERVFNLVTESRLVELADHNAPLIKRLRLETPGTFNHSLAVASFAEMCASAIGENPYLARAAAYYHDVGKLENPQYYRENQTDDNLHDELLPELSADIIRAHTTDGLKLCEKYRIPAEVAEITVQHHGTLLIPVFYEKAKKMTDSPVDAYVYSHHGITPTSKIAAIIMLCDASEAALRTLESMNIENVNNVLSFLFEHRIVAGQFKNCDISLKELDTIKNTLISACGGMYHKRVKYPGE
ncbi:MAG: HDIG domain-containing protein [Firmicutes bacterium]|nr:HDIG domain-containing protein [Bacillota bacterium]